MKLGKKASKNIVENCGYVRVNYVWFDKSIEVWDYDFYNDVILWKWNDEEILHASKLKTKIDKKQQDSYVFRVGSTWYNIVDFEVIKTDEYCQQWQ